MSGPDIELELRTLAAGTDHPAALPDANLIWQRASARRYDPATRIVHLAELTAGIVSGVAGVAALIALLPSFAATLRSMDQTVVRLSAVGLCATAVVALVLAKELLAED